MVHLDLIQNNLWVEREHGDGLDVRLVGDLNRRHSGAKSL
jgi:hypothetical protein